MSFSAPDFGTPTPPPEMAPPPTDPTGKKPKKKSMAPTFLGAETSPTGANLGGNTLLGQ